MTAPKLSKAQSQLFASVVEAFGDEPLNITSCCELEHSEERSVLAYATM